MLGKIQTPIGEHAIDIEKGHLDSLRLKQQLGGEIQSGLNDLHKVL